MSTNQPSVVSILSLVSLALAPAFVAAEQATVPRGAVMAVRLDRSLSSEQVVPGDAFSATVLDPVYIDGKLAIASGSAVDGVVTLVRSRAQGYRSGVIGLRLVRLQAPDGRAYVIDGGLVDYREPPVVNRAPAARAVVVIGSETDTSGKRPSSLVGDAGENEGALADRWSHSGLGPDQAEIESGAELTFELRRALTVARPLSAE